MQEAPQAARVLVVDDEDAVRRTLVRMLQRRGMHVTDCPSAGQALEHLEAGLAPVVVISDFKMPVMDGVEFLSRVKQRWPRIRRVMITGFSEPEALQRAINEAQVHRFLAKPWDHAALLQVVEDCVADHDILERLTALTTDLEAKVEQRTRMLSQAKTEWLRTVDAIGEPLIVISTDYEVQRANVNLSERTGIAVRAMKGRRCWQTVMGGDLSGPCLGCPVARCLETGGPHEGEVIDKQSGAVWVVRAYPVPIDGAESGDPTQVANVVCSYRDVTEERDLQARLIQSEKMAAVGTLAGGVAHEINNPMGGILAFAQLLMRDRALDDDAKTYVKEIEESAQRCRKIVQGLLGFSRSAPTDQRGPVDMNSVVAKALFLVEHTIGRHRVTIRRDMAPAVQELSANGNQLQQVVVNLISNACGAIDGIGNVTVRTGEGPATVWVEVQDDGVGIAAADRDRVFMPFFTTKPQGEGTGLGLSVSLGIVEAHGGTLLFDSSPGHGTTFRMTLPARRPTWPGLGSVDPGEPASAVTSSEDK